MGLAWVSYFWGFYGYCLLRGYDVTPRQLLSSTWPPANTVKLPGDTTPIVPPITPAPATPGR